MPGIISFKHEFIFIHIPKTGGTSVSHHIKPHLGENDLIIGHNGILSARSYIGTNLWNKFRKITIIRCPYDRAVSQYYTGLFDPRDDWKSFDEFAQKMRDYTTASTRDDMLYYPQYNFIIDERLRPMMDEYILFDNLELDTLRTFKFLPQYQPLPFYRVRKERSRNLEDYYTIKNTEDIRFAYSEDIKLYNDLKEATP